MRTMREGRRKKKKIKLFKKIKIRRKRYSEFSLFQVEIFEAFLSLCLCWRLVKPSISPKFGYNDDDGYHACTLVKWKVIFSDDARATCFDEAARLAFQLLEGSFLPLAGHRAATHLEPVFSQEFFQHQERRRASKLLEPSRPWFLPRIFIHFFLPASRGEI